MKNKKGSISTALSSTLNCQKYLRLILAYKLGIGTLFTLFVVPAFYLLLARDHQQHLMTQDIAG